MKSLLLLTIAALLIISSVVIEASSAQFEEYIVRRNAAIVGDGPAPHSKCDSAVRALLEEPQHFPEVVDTPVGTDFCKEKLGNIGYSAITAQPQQIHLAIHRSSSNVTALWTTNTSSNASSVCWGVKGGNFSCESGPTWTYNPISLIPWVGHLHGASMINLVPAVQYCYRVGDPEINLWSEDVCFLAPQYEKDELFVFLGGDQGSVQLVGFKVAAQMRADEIAKNLTVDAFWHLGDLAYSTLDPPRDNFEFFWDMYMQQEESLCNHVPMVATYGNHDFSGGDSGAYLNRYINPGSAESGSKYYFAYEHGPIKYISMCTEVGLVPVDCNYAPGSAQYKWMEAEFASVNRTRTPWLILASHRPMYSTDTSTDSGNLRLYIEPLLVKYKVDVEIAGHMHETEVISPVVNNTAQLHGVHQTSTNTWLYNKPTAPAHFTVGTLGAVIAERYVEPQPMWSLLRAGSLFDPYYGYSTLWANRSQLQFTFYNQKDNTTLWQVVINK